MTKHYFYNYEELSHAFMYDDASGYGSCRQGRMYYNGNTCYSYGTAIACKYPKKNIIIISNYYYSQTTNNQINYLRRAVDRNTWTIIYADELDIKKLKTYFNNKFKLLMGRSCSKRRKDKKDTQILSHCEDRSQLLNLYSEAIVAEEQKLYKISDKIKEFYKINKEYCEQLIETRNTKQKEREESHKKEYDTLIELVLDWSKKIELDKKLFNHKKYRDNINEYNKIVRSGWRNYSEDDENSPLSLTKLDDLFTIYVGTCKEKGIIDTIKYYSGYKAFIVHAINYIFFTKVMHLSKDECIPEQYNNLHIDLVWYDAEQKLLKTNRYVTITENFIKGIVVLMKNYLNPKNTHNLIGLHVGYYTIGSYDDKYIQIGCHKFCKRNVELLLEDLKDAGY